MISTLSTGLNKSGEYIRNNCIDIRMRQITFKNDEKIFFTKDDKIPASEVNVGRYLQCSTLGFKKNSESAMITYRYQLSLAQLKRKY